MLSALDIGFFVVLFFAGGGGGLVTTLSIGLVVAVVWFTYYKVSLLLRCAVQAAWEREQYYFPICLHFQTATVE